MESKQVSQEWLDAYDLTINGAAFWLVFNKDPREIQYICKDDPEYHNLLDDGSDPIEAVKRMVDRLLSPVRAKVIPTTVEVLKADGQIDTMMTYISKSGWLAWCLKHGHADLVAKFTDSATASKRVVTFDSSSELAREYRGCKRHIIEHWTEIKQLHGMDADGQQVLRYLQRVLDKSECPTKKTVQNCLIDLKRDKVLP